MTIGPIERTKHYRVDESAVVCRYTGDCGVMVDVGAHYGSACIPFLDKGWAVHAFEPCSTTRNILHDRIRAHPNARQCRIDARGLSDKAGSGIPFYSSPESTGISSLSAFQPTHALEEKISLTTLEDYIKESELSKIDFLKVDAEGHDLFVLRGCPFTTIAPRIVVCEFEDAKTVQQGYCWKDIALLLHEHGYDIWVSEWHPILRYGIAHDWVALSHYPCELHNHMGWGNLIAFREDIEPEQFVNVFRSGIYRRSVLRNFVKALNKPGRAFRYISEHIGNVWLK